MIADREPTDEELDALLVYQTDPVGFAEDVLGLDLWDLQKQILRALVTHRDVVVASCHGVGKSAVAGVATLWRLLCFLLSRVVTTAPTDRQVKEILWTEIRSMHAKALWPLGGRLLTTALEIDDGWSAIGFTTRDDPTRFQGIHAPFVMKVVDEAAGITENVRVGLAALTASGDALSLEIGNPTDPTSGFAREFDRPGVAKFQISAFDTPNFTEFGITVEDIRSGAWKAKITGPLPRPYLVTPTWVRDRWEVWCGGRIDGESSPLWRSRVLGLFPEDRPDQLIPLAWILAANRRFEETVDVDDSATLPRTIAVDVARFGDDESAIAARIGRRLAIVNATLGADTTSTARRAAGLARKISAGDIRVDVIGIGAGVSDRLVDTEDRLVDPGVDVIEINVSESPKRRTDCMRMRDEIFWNLRQLLSPECKDPIAIAPDEELTKQLSSIRYGIDPTNGKIKVESKDSMKSRGLGSPDRADAAAMAFAEGVESSGRSSTLVGVELPANPWSPV